VLTKPKNLLSETEISKFVIHVPIITPVLVSYIVYIRASVLADFFAAS
jgi:hypothetical protein